MVGGWATHLQKKYACEMYRLKILKKYETTTYFKTFPLSNIP